MDKYRIKTYFRENYGVRYKVQKRVLFFWWTVGDCGSLHDAKWELDYHLREWKEKTGFKSVIISQKEALDD